MTDDRILHFEGINNFRDYGGYGIAGGGRVKRGLLFRSGQHVDASDGDLTGVAALGLATVIDLRGESERELNPCRRHEGFAGQVLVCEGETASLASHIDASEGVVTEADARAAMCRLYAEMPYRPNLTAVMRRYFAALGEGGGASLIHCFAGKDRTGLSVALTHHILGVHPDDAMQDYLLTNVAMEGRTFAGKTAGRSGKNHHKYAAMSREASKALTGVAEEFLTTAFAAIHDSHGTTDAYLADVLGIDRALADRIRANFTTT